MKCSDVVAELLKIFPRYQGAYKEHIEYNGELLPHVFFGETINEDILKLLNDRNHNREELNSIFNFMERMASEGDLKVQEILTMTILERLGEEFKNHETVSSYMGNKTKITFNEIERFWGDNSFQ